MRRVFAAISVIALAAIGAAGCGSSDAKDSGAETSVTAPSEEDVLDDEFIEGDEQEEAAEDQSPEAACLALAGPMDQVTEAMTAANEQTATDPQAVLDIWVVLAEDFEQYADSVTNVDVKPFAERLANESAGIRDDIETVFVNKDATGMDQYTANLREFQKTYESLQDLCAGRDVN